jgi:hypothetical protein
MARTTQNLPRALRTPRRTTASTPPGRTTRIAPWALFVVACVVAAIAPYVIITGLNRPKTRAGEPRTVDSLVGPLLAGTPQHERTLGDPTAPVTLQVFLDLKDPDSRDWFLAKLPDIIQRQIRTGKLKLEYRAYKTNTYDPQEFVKEQTAALAAGAQNKLWNYIYTFFFEQGSENEAYVTNAYLNEIANHIPGLNLARWHYDQHTGHREEQTTRENQTANTLNLYVTPSFRIGKTGGPLHNYSGHSITKYGKQHPIALPTAQDLNQAIHELTTAVRASD